MNAQPNQSSCWELILGIGLLVVQLCTWPTEISPAALRDSTPDILEFPQGSVFSKPPAQHYYDSSAASRLPSTSVPSLEES
jgi:hypothetical protein